MMIGEKNFDLDVLTMSSMLCEASLEPLIICSKESILNCTESALMMLQCPTLEEFMKLDVVTLLKKHFSPSTVIKNNIRSAATIKDISHCRVWDSITNQTKIASVKVKSWIYNNCEYYTVNIKDVPSLVLAAHEHLCDSTDKNSLSFTKGDLDSIQSENQIEQTNSSPFVEFSWLADSLPCLLWCLSATGDTEYVNKKLTETLGLGAFDNWEYSIHPRDWSEFSPIWNENRIKALPSTYELRYRHIKYSQQNESSDELNPNEFTKSTPPTSNPSIYSTDPGYFLEKDDEGYRWYLLNSQPVKNEAGMLTRWVVTLADIHDHKLEQVEKHRLVISERSARAAVRQKSEFLSMMSHEFRTPLFGVVGNISMLNDTNLNYDQRSLLDSIYESSRHLMTVIEDILDFQRIEAKKLNIECIPFNLSDVTGQVGKLMGDKASAKNIRFDIKPIDSDVPALVGDANRILQILTYLVSNAIKFTHTGRVKVYTKVTQVENVQSDKERLNVEFIIKDTGIGINPEILSDVFTPWMQADNSIRRSYGGSGLGLAISKSLIDLMNGEIRIDSTVDVGTKVKVKLTLDKYVATGMSNMDSDLLSWDKLIRHQMFRSNLRMCYTPSSSPTNNSPKSPPASTPGLSKAKSIRSPGSKPTSLPPLVRRVSSNDSCAFDRQRPSSYSSVMNGSASSSSGNQRFQVLLAEDNFVNQAILKRFLSKMGKIDCHMANDGLEALEIYHKFPKRHFHAILLDQSMPKMDGDTVCKEIRKTDTEQIIISISANTLLADQKSYQALGLNDHISKPVTYNNFQVILSKWLKASLTFADSKKTTLCIPTLNRKSSRISVPPRSAPNISTT